MIISFFNNYKEKESFNNIVKFSAKYEKIETFQKECKKEKNTMILFRKEDSGNDYLRYFLSDSNFASVAVTYRFSNNLSTPFNLMFQDALHDDLNECILKNVTKRSIEVFSKSDPALERDVKMLLACDKVLIADIASSKRTFLSQLAKQFKKQYFLI